MTASKNGIQHEVPAASSSKESDDLKMGYLMKNLQDDSGFSQWITAMKMVVQLPGGIPSDFRSRLWLSLADRYISQRGISWNKVEKLCFNELPQPDDTKLGNQIAKDLHRTGCTLFCGEAGKENQILLKKVLVAYARWNKFVGYCQGFNMLAALILQVTNKCVPDALKVMIYLVEGVLPDSYFANNLRGLSVDMAVFRDLMHLKLPRLSQHLEKLQRSTKDGDRSYEPPLTNVFTIQWFLTLFCNCLPQPTVLRIWDLIFLEGNEILLKTALCIWQKVSPRIMQCQSADEFYGTMTDITKHLVNSKCISSNELVRAIVTVGPLTGIENLRKQYLFSLVNKCNNPSEHKQKYKQTIPLDIGVLKKQYSKIKQRQKQAHVIFFSALSRQYHQKPSEAINHLLIKKNNTAPLIRNGNSIPVMLNRTKESNISGLKKEVLKSTPPLNDTINWKDSFRDNVSSSSSSTDTELCDDDERELSEGEEEPISNDHDSRSKSDNTSSIKIVQNLEFNGTEPATDSLEEDLINLESTCEKTDFDPVFDSRRNSMNALKIMQENSMILHRIMNCQNRTPSPPSVVYDIDEPQKESDSMNLTDLDTIDSRLFGREDESPSISLIDDNVGFLNLLPNIQNRSPSPASVNELEEPRIDEVKDDVRLTNVDTTDSRIFIQEDESPSFSFASDNVDFLSFLPSTSRDNFDIGLSPDFSRNVELEKSSSLDEKYNTLLVSENPHIYESKSDSSISTGQFCFKEEHNLFTKRNIVDDTDSIDLIEAKPEIPERELCDTKLCEIKNNTTLDKENEQTVRNHKDNHFDNRNEGTEKKIGKTSRELIEENVKVLELMLNRKKTT